MVHMEKSERSVCIVQNEQIRALQRFKRVLHHFGRKGQLDGCINQVALNACFLLLAIISTVYLETEYCHDNYQRQHVFFRRPRKCELRRPWRKHAGRYTYQWRASQLKFGRAFAFEQCFLW